MLDRDRKVKTSPALWIPVIWLVLVASRPLSEWGNITYSAETVGRIAEEHPLERNVYTGVLVLGLIVLISRGARVTAFLRENVPLVVFLSYCAVSVVWSDFPDVALKRWIKSLGDVVMIAIVVTDPGRTAALKRLLARLAFFLVPISVLLIKYYPDWGRAYNYGSGDSSVVGVTTDKNMLGVICLVCGLGTVWSILEALRNRVRLRNRPLIAHATILLMVLWLFHQANSATSAACFTMGSTLMVVTSIPSLRHRRNLVPFMIVTFVTVSFSALFLHVGSGMVESMGRDSTLTGRTELWEQLVKMIPNPMVGSGFESFWLGPRLDRLWSYFHWKPNEAHNGYLEVFLNLGGIGVALLGVLIVSGYRNAVKMSRLDPAGGKIRLAFFLMGIVYSFTEAGFRMLSPIWIAFLLSVTAVPVALRQYKDPSKKMIACNTADELVPFPETVLLGRN